MDNLIVCGIYSIVHKSSNKKYIGSSIDILRRWKKHIYELETNIHENKYLQQAWNRYGYDEFEFNVLQIVEVKDLQSVEQSYLPQEKTYNALKEQGFYNLCPVAGTCEGKEVTEETRKKISLVHKDKKVSDETKLKMSSAMLTPENKMKNRERGLLQADFLRTLSKSRIGKKRSDKERENISNGRKGIVFSEETKEKMRQAKVGKKHTQEHKDNISKSLREKYK